MFLIVTIKSGMMTVPSLSVPTWLKEKAGEAEHVVPVMHTQAHALCISARKQSKLHRTTQAETTALSETQTGLSALSLLLVQRLFPLVQRKMQCMHKCISVNLPADQFRQSLQ